MHMCPPQLFSIFFGGHSSSLAQGPIDPARLTSQQGPKNSPVSATSPTPGLDYRHEQSCLAFMCVLEIQTQVPMLF